MTQSSKIKLIYDKFVAVVHKQIVVSIYHRNHNF